MLSAVWISLDAEGGVDVEEEVEGLGTKHADDSNRRARGDTALEASVLGGAISEAIGGDNSLTAPALTSAASLSVAYTLKSASVMCLFVFPGAVAGVEPLGRVDPCGGRYT